MKDAFAIAGFVPLMQSLTFLAFGMKRIRRN